MSRGVPADGQGYVWPLQLFGVSPSTNTYTVACWAGPGLVVMLISQYSHCCFPVIECPQGELPEEAMIPHSSTLAWKIPWTEEPGGLQSMGS